MEIFNTMEAMHHSKIMKELEEINLSFVNLRVEIKKKDVWEENQPSITGAFLLILSRAIPF